MRAISAKQRFPVPQWKADLETMHDTAIKTSKKQITALKPSTPAATAPSTPISSFTNLAALWNPKKASLSVPSTPPNASGVNTRSASPVGVVGASSADNGRMSMGVRIGPGHIVEERQSRSRKRLNKVRPGSKESSVASTRRRSLFPLSGRSSRANSTERTKAKDKEVPPVPAIAANLGQAVPTIPRISENFDEDQDKATSLPDNGIEHFDFSIGNPFEGDEAEDSDTNSSSDRSPTDEYILTPEQVENERRKVRLAGIKRELEINAGEGPSTLDTRLDTSSPPGSSPETRSLVAGPTRPQTPSEADGAPTNPAEPYLSLGNVLQGKRDFKLQNVTPSFDDPTGFYYEAFGFKLRKLSGKNSETGLCIEEYITQSEKDWFKRYNSVKMGKSAASSRASSIFKVEREGIDGPMATVMEDEGSDHNHDQFLLQEDYKPPTGLKNFMLQKIGTWPLYTFLLAFVSPVVQPHA